MTCFVVFSGKDPTDVHHRAVGADPQRILSGEDGSHQGSGDLRTVPLSERGEHIEQRLSEQQQSLTVAVTFFSLSFSGCDVCGGHS